MRNHNSIAASSNASWPAILASMLTLLTVVFVLFAPAQAQSMTLQQAMSELPTMKEQGMLGEQQNGYLGVVAARGNANVVASLINDARRSEYTRIADQNSIAVSDVEAMAGKRAIERSPAGHYIQLDGRWVVKR